MATTELIDDAVTWRQTLARIPMAGADDVYFRPEYAALYPDGRPCCFQYEDGDALFLLPLLLREIPGTPYFDFETPYGYGGPLSNCDDPSFIDQAWQNLRQWCCRQHVVAGFLRFHPLLDNQRWTSSAVRVVADRETVVLTLGQDKEQVWAGYGSDTRNKIRKAEKNGAVVHKYSNMESLEKFSGLYAEHMHELSAYDDYFFGDEYFKSIHNLGQNSYAIYLVEHQGELMGGALVLLSQYFAHYHLSSSLRRFNPLAPNALLRHAVTMDQLKSGRRMILYGGGRTNAADDSLLKFKAGFSPERRSFHFGTFIGEQEAYTSLCERWRSENPALAERFGSRFLCYRYR